MRDPLYDVNMTKVKTITFKTDVDIVKHIVDGAETYEWVNMDTGQDSDLLFDTVLEAEQDAVKHFGVDYE